ncbi:DUF4214 domain-containing protein, partial [Massilia sp. BJB1822]|uniref:DUF4214 domain-containing protein n=1 Tax=Massilia sp. BJB1822 TaxID=2744470 RepID=UPI001592EE63
LVKSIDAAGYLTETSYDGQSRVTATVRYATPVSVTDPNKLPAGNASTADRTNRRYYDKEGRLRATLDAEGYLTEYNYNALGQVIETVAYAERTTNDLRPQGEAFREYKLYDGKGQLVATIDGQRYLTEMAYDANGLLVGKTRYAQDVNYIAGMRLADLRPAGGERQSVSYDYNAMRQLTRETSADGTVTTHTYDLAGNRIASIVAAGSSEERGAARQYDARGQLLAEVSGEGAYQLSQAKTEAEIKAVWAAYATRYTYNAAGLRTSMTDAAGNRTLYYYDRDGRLSHTINGAGEVEARQYNVLNRLEKITLHAIRLSASQLTTLTGGQNDAAFANLIAGLASSNDASTRFDYDQRGLQVSQTDALGFTTTLHYDAFGQVDTRTTQIDKSGSALIETLRYSRRGELTDTGANNGGQQIATHTEYDAFGRAISRRDANGQTTTMAYDRLGRQVAVKLPLGPATAATYDAFGRVLTQTDAAGFTTRTSYDTQQRSITLSTPEGVTQTVRNNRHGQQIGLTDGNGNTTTFEYDRDGKLLKTVNASAQESRGVYDKAGRLFQSIDANGTVTEYSYDAANRVLSRTVDPTGLNLSTSYTYDIRGQVQTVTDPRSIVTRNEYDKKGQLISVTVDSNGDGLKLKTSFEYDGRGRTLSVTDPALRLTRYEYDQLGRRTAEVVDPNAMALRTSYTYDANGNVIARRDANQNLSRFSYDANNRLAARIDGAGAVTRFDYDAAGRLTHTIAHAKALDLSSLEPQIPTPRSAAGDTAWLLQRVAADAARDRNTYTVYNRDGQAKYSIDGAGAVTQFAYDGNGNILESTRYATAISLAGLTAAPSADDIAAALGKVVAGNGAYSPAHRREVFGYDAANRLTLSALALSKSGDYATWAVTRNEYDANGNLTGTRSLQNAYQTLSSAVPKEKDIAAYSNNPLMASNLDAVKRFAYDRANRQIASAVALGENDSNVMQWAVTLLGYDNAGNLTSRTEYAEAKPAAALPLGQNAVLYASWAQAMPGTINNRITRFGYDNANRLTITTDSVGARTIRELDGSGNVIKTTRYARPLRAMGDIIVTDNVPDRVERAEYDGANRLRFTLDAEGYIKEQRYDGMGRVTSSILYDQPVPDAAGIAAASARAGAARVTSYVFDAQGNLTSATDALLVKESYKYDALGNKTEFTNKLNNTWRYAYDGAGRMVQETSPQVQAYDSNGLLATRDNLGTPTLQSLITRLEYDALGNLLARREAAGSNVERLTEYRYDAAGRQTHTIRPSQRIYDLNYDRQIGMDLFVANERDSGQLATIVTYDALGNAVSNKDVGGKISYKTYDSAGRVRYEVDAAGYVTSYERDSFGGATKMTRHATPIVVGQRLSLASAGVKSLLRANTNEDRTLETTYDRLGRVQTTREPEVAVFDQNSLGSPYLTASKITRYDYTAFGEVRQRSVYAANSSGQPLTEAAVTRSYFNKRGEKIAEIAALNDKGGYRSGYLTAYTYDAAGNLLTQAEYAKAFGTWTDYTYANPGAAANDRTTAFTYDALNRKLTETRVGVVFADNLGNANATPRNLTTSYTYDAVGNQKSVTDALQGRTYSYYDALGRLTASAKTQVQAVPEILDGGNQLVEFRLDIHGNAVLRIEYEQGALAGGVSESAYVASSALNPKNRITATEFDAYGRARQVLDAVQFMQERRGTVMSYDEYGRVAKKWRAVRNGSTLDNSYEITRYDDLGRVSEIWMPGNANIISQTGAPFTRKTSLYNAFGEVTSSGFAVGDGPVTEVYFARYDRAGRAWISNNGDGVDKIALYDIQGQNTALIQTTSDDVNILRRMNSAAEINLIDKVVRTNIRYDLLGHVVDRRPGGDLRMRVLQRVEAGWVPKPLDRNQSAADSLVLLGDSTDTSNGRRLLLQYRLIGSTEWINAAEPRLQVLDGNPVFNTRGLAPGEYEYKVLIQPAGETPYERETGSLRLVEDGASDPMREMVMLYMLLFGRAPDNGGLNFWLKAYNMGLRRDEILQSMVQSAEANGRFANLAPIDVIRTIYKTALGYNDTQLAQSQSEIYSWAEQYYRATAPDKRGTVLADLLGTVIARQDGFSKLLETRSQAIAAYIRSGGTDPATTLKLMEMAVSQPATVVDEARRIGIQETGRMQLVRLYITMFGRAPDQGGFAFWVKALSDGVTLEGVADAMLRSAEARSPWLYPDFGLTPEQYRQQLVTRAYGLMLERAPSAAELADWTGRLSGPNAIGYGKFIVQLMNSVANYEGNDPVRENDRKLFSNKVALSYTASVTVGQTLDSDGASILLSGVTSAATAQEAAEKALLALQAAARTSEWAASGAATAANANPLESMRRTMARMYLMVMGRLADKGGLDFYIAGKPSTEAEWARVAEWFLSSAEAKIVFPDWQTLSNRDFITRLYRNALGYVPTGKAVEEEIAAYTAELARGTNRFTVAAKLAKEMLTTSQMLRDDQVHKSLLDNRTAVSITVAQSLNLENDTVRDNVLKLVTATDMKAALDAAYAGNLDTMRARLELTRTAAGTGRALADLLAQAAQATIDARNAMTAVEGNALALARLRLTQLYIVLLDRNPNNPPDLGGMEFYLSGPGRVPVEAQADSILQSAEAQKIISPSLSNRAFIEKICERMLGSSVSVPAPQLAQWLNELNSSTPPTRGKMAWNIIQYVLGYTDAVPNPDSLARMNARAVLMQKVADTFVKVDENAQIKVQTWRATQEALKREVDRLEAELRSADSGRNSANASLNEALTFARRAMSEVAVIGDMKGAKRMEVMRMYALMHQRTPSHYPPQPSEIDYWLNIDSSAVAYSIITSAEQQDYFRSGDSAETFVGKLYQRILGRAPSAQEVLRDTGFLSQNASHTYVKGELAVALINRLCDYANADVAQLEYKKRIDGNIDAMMTTLRDAYQAAYSSAQSAAQAARYQRDQLSGAVSSYQGQYNDAASETTLKPKRDAAEGGQKMLSSPARAAVINVYAALRGSADYGGVLFYVRNVEVDASNLRGVVAGIISEEYPADDLEFLYKLYATTLMRDFRPPLSEINAYLQQLKNGRTRADLAWEVMQSPEAQGKYPRKIPDIERALTDQARADIRAYNDALAYRDSLAGSLQNARTNYNNFINSGELQRAETQETQSRLAYSSANAIKAAFSQEWQVNDPAINAVRARDRYATVEQDLAKARKAYQDSQQEVLANYEASTATGGLIRAATNSAANAAKLQAAEGNAYRAKPEGGIAQRVTHVFLSVLDRAPSLTELQIWFDKIRATPGELEQALVPLATALMTGPEASRRNLFPPAMSNSDFVIRIYQAAFGRTVAASDDGVQFWTARLNEGISRDFIAVAISSGGINNFSGDTLKLNARTSAILATLSTAVIGNAEADAAIELSNQIARNEATRIDTDAQTALAASPDGQLMQQIVLTYLLVLQRAPDPRGLRYYFNALRPGNSNSQLTLANALFDSTEAATLYPSGMQPAAFIDQLFRKALGRGASEAEIARYTAQMASKTRGEVAVNIIKDVLNSTAYDLVSHTTRTLLIDKMGVALERAMTDTASYSASVRAAIPIVQKAVAAGVTTLYTVPFTPIAGLSVSGQRLASGANLYAVDRWGNVLSSGDLRDQRYQITYTYDHNNQLLSKSHYALPGVNAPTVQNRYDALGRVVATVDAQGNTNTVSYNSNGYQVMEAHADGGKVFYTMDRFGQRLSSNSLRSANVGTVTNYTYDQLGRMLTRNTADVDIYAWDRSSLFTNRARGQLGEFYQYDELGRRIGTTANVQWSSGSVNDPSSLARSTTRYDLSGNVVQSTDAEGRVTSYVYDALNRKLRERRADQGELSWAYDAQGRLTSHVDLGQNTTRYLYNASNQLRVATTNYGPDYGISNEQNIFYVYEDATGNLSEIHDTGLGQLSKYTYDVLGNRISEKVYSQGKQAMVQDQILYYDRQMRLEKVDARVRGADYQLSYTFDNNGNRLTATTVFNTMLDVKKTVSVQYRYDAMNRETYVSGNVNSFKRSGVLMRPNEIRGRTGRYQMEEEDVNLAWNNPSSTDSAIATHDIKYDWQGNRIEDNNEKYAYDAAGRLSEITVNGAVTGYRHYDSAGRVIASLEKDEIRLSAYDRTGRLEMQRVLDGSGQRIRNDIKYAYLATGEVDYYQLFNASNGLMQTTKNEYRLARENRLLTRTDVTNAGDSQSKSSTRKYDVNGNLESAVVGDETRLFINDSAGRVLEKIEIKRGIADATTRTLIVNGEVLGSSSSSYESFSSVHESLTGNSATADNASAYVVQRDGENLASIAKAVWGNERLWYLIADANGMNGSETLKAGQTLTIPQRASAVYNDTATFKPYDASELVGNTTPELAIMEPAAPAPAKKKKCGGIGQLVMVAVAVVATVMTAGAAASALASASGVIGGAAGAASTLAGAVSAAGMLATGASGLSAGLAFAAGAIGGAVGSIASQAIGMAIGAQDGFSWKGVALSAIGGGISAGVASAGASGSLGAIFEGAQTPGLIARAALSNVATQAVGNVLGLQSGFSWRSVTASAAGAAAGSAAGQALNKAGAFASWGEAGELARNTLSGFAAGTAAAIARGGKVDVAQ